MGVAGFVSAQDQPAEHSHYLFPSFLEGSVLTKSGMQHRLMLNYNLLSEEMIFDTNGEKLAMYELFKIDTIFLGGRKFIPYENKFVEVLLVNAGYTLYAEHKCELIDVGVVDPYGVSNQTSSTSSYSSLLTNGRSYQMELPDRYKAKQYVNYLLMRKGNVNRFTNLRQVLNYYPDKKKEAKAFVSKNDLKFGSETDMVKLIVFFENN